MPSSRPRRKRSRKSSSDAEQKTTSLPKRCKPSDWIRTVWCDGILGRIRNGNRAFNVMMNELYTARPGDTKDWNHRQHHPKSLIDLLFSLTKNLAESRDEIDDKLSAVYNELRNVKRCVADIEERGANNVISPDDPEVVFLRRRLGVLEDTPADRSHPLTPLVVKGINETETETTAQLLATCQELILQFQVTTTITAARRLGIDTRGCKPRMVSMRLPNIEIVIMVM